MTPEDRTPFASDQPQPTAYWPPQSQAFTPPPVYQPPAKPPISKRRAFWTRGPGIMVIIVVAGTVLFGLFAVTGALSGGPAANPFTVNLTGCEFTGDSSLPSATAGFTITNTSSTTRSATVKVEYRDGDGSRLDTDTAYVRNIAPGDTVRHEEVTFLDAAPTGTMTCGIVGVR